MTHQPEHIKRLTSTLLEMEAGVIVSALEENGIKATLTGVATAGFRAEAPGWVHVLVAEEDLPRAQSVLDEVRKNQSDEVDWSSVDVGEPEGEVLPDAFPWWMSYVVWRRIGYVVATIMVTWFFAGVGAMVITTLLRAVGILR
jgi:Putative prokaryotic signal transducing protein